MPQGPKEDCNMPTLSSRNPHFFKIILEDTLKENKLRVPKDFVRKCGETLSDSVSVKLPCGSKWKMKLKEYDGRFWLENGWPEFVEHYSIGRGNLLTFRYEGNSELHVIVFGITTVEIDYPSGPLHFDESDIDGKLRSPKREVIDDDFIEILDDCLPCHKTGVKSSLPCSPPPKRMKISPTAGKIPSNLSLLRAKGSHCSETVVGNRMGRGNSKKSKADMKGKHDFHVKSYGDESRWRTSKIFGRMKPLRGQEKYAALQKANGFKSKRPFFEILMQPSYVHGNRMTFSYTFAKRYIKNESCNVILKVLDGRTWSVKYTFGVYDRVSTARFRSGWKEFVRENNLKVGDVCIFVLLKSIQVAFEVIIFRVNGNSKAPMSRTHKGVKQEQSLTNKAKSGGFAKGKTSMPISHKYLPAKQANRCISTPPQKNRKKHSVNFTEKARTLKRAPSGSKKPFFKIVIKSSYSCTGVAYCLNIPLDFARKYIKNEGDVVLRVPNGRSWSAQFRFRSVRNGTSHAAEIHSGWKDFSVDNCLEVGDICNFKLLNGTKISFEVSIVRVADDANPERTHAGESAKCASKQKGVKTEID